MNTIILPVDFSEASSNAVSYVAAMSCERKISRIIVLHAIRVTLYNDMVLVANGEIVMEERRKAEALLIERSRELVAGCPRSVQVQTAMSEMPVLRAVHHLIRDVDADLVAVGVGGPADAGYLSEYVIGLARTSTLPVLVVPRGSVYHRPQQAVVVARAGQDTREGLEWVHREYPQMELTVYTAGGPDATKGLVEFAEERHAELIVALPGRKSLFYRLTHRDLRRAIAGNAKYPVLLLK